MRKHPCIFCEKSRQRADHLSFPRPATLLEPATANRLVGVPVFRNRVSPVLDACTRMVLVGPNEGEGTVTRAVSIGGCSLFDRAGELKRLGVGTVICGAVSEAFSRLIEAEGIELISGVSGEVGEVLAAYRNGTLNQERFRMPGYGKS